MAGRDKKGGRRHVWVLDPHVGGVPPTPTIRAETKRRLRAHAATHHAGNYERIEVRFRGALCYVSAVVAGSDVPLNLCRLRHFAADRWSVAFFAYSSEKYEPSIFLNGTFFGTPEEGFEIGAIYLR